MRATVSIVIPVFNNWWLTRRLLRVLDAVRTASSPPFEEVILVDNASSDETPHGIAAFDWVRYLRHEQNRNFSGGCNAGARLASGDVILFLNNDALPLDGALDVLRDAFADESLAIAGARLLFEDGVVQGAGMVLRPNAHWGFFHRNLPDGTSAVRASRDDAVIPGAVLAVRRDWFLTANGFDERYRNGFEDVDLCMRARRDGGIVRYVADAAFTHYEGATPGRFEFELENELRFFRQWHPDLTRIPRVERGDVGAIVVRRDARGGLLSERALAALVGGMRSFGHPIVSRIAPWQLVDARFRRAATIDWHSEQRRGTSGVRVEVDGDGFASLRSVGAFDVRVPWLPAVDEMTSPCALEYDEAIGDVAIIARDPQAPNVKILSSRLHEWLPNANIHLFDGESLIAQTPQRRRVSLAVVYDLTDPYAFANVRLGLTGVPIVARDLPSLRRIYADDLVAFANETYLVDAAAALFDDAARRADVSRYLPEDCRRRFSPRRSAMRALDLARAARFGPERPAPRRSDAPLKLD